MPFLAAISASRAVDPSRSLAAIARRNEIPEPTFSWCSTNAAACTWTRTRHRLRWRMLSPTHVRILESEPNASGDDVESELLLTDSNGRSASTLVRRLSSSDSHFAFLEIDAHGERMYAARDITGVGKLYYWLEEGVVALSSIELKPKHRRTSSGFLSAFLTPNAHRSSTRTIDDGVTAVAVGELISGWQLPLLSERFWTPCERSTRDPSSERGLDSFSRSLRDTLELSVAISVRGSERPWSELSGGVDSSTICCLASSGRPDSRLAAAYHCVDSNPGADERSFARSVSAHLGLRLDEVPSEAPWSGDVSESKVPSPRVHHPFWNRQLRIERHLTGEGASVLLSGTGADHLFSTGLSAIPDLLLGGEVRRGLSLAMDVAAGRQRSIYHVITRSVTGVYGRTFEPLAERLLGPPAWLSETAVELAVCEDLLARKRARSVSGSAQTTQLLLTLDDLSHSLEQDLVRNCPARVYPFLRRSVVDFVAACPPEMFESGGTTKRVLRASVRELVPDLVLERRTKGILDFTILKTVSRESQRLRRMLYSSRLADLGLVSIPELIKALDAACAGRSAGVRPLMLALAAEEWLQAE